MHFRERFNRHVKAWRFQVLDGSEKEVNDDRPLLDRVVKSNQPFERKFTQNDHSSRKVVNCHLPMSAQVNQTNRQVIM